MTRVVILCARAGGPVDAVHERWEWPHKYVTKDGPIRDVWFCSYCGARVKVVA